ncbi:hypothetical protein [Pontibacter oryzae]|uniref:DUF3575 domain-containing protein n=1 Tax=Pontibacter oryzae TaxID=2304593 RepID=A0A399S046_9BACT|nr:hypothetical protein [Pontibacter oryzae]RIJ37376.1 hypothetical protein D1627_09575 [Pontibacter oryzae]
MQKVRSVVLWLFILCSQFPALAQESTMLKNAVTLKFFGLSGHIRQVRNPSLFPNRLDDNGIFVLNLGGIVGYERFVWRDRLSIRVEQGLYADCAAEFAGFTHLGWRGVIWQSGRHSVNGGFGPTLVYRQDWNKMQDYEDDGYFSRSGGWQYKFYWYGGEFEYNYMLKQNTELSVNMVPGLPELISVGVGIRKHF